MIFKDKEYSLNGKQIVLRNARPDDAKILIDFLETVTGETRF